MSYPRLAAESDGAGELLLFCPECWQREGTGEGPPERVFPLPARVELSAAEHAADARGDLKQFGPVR